MFEAKITIACPDLALAASALAAAINFRTPGAEPKAPATVQTPALAAPVQPPMPAPAPVSAPPAPTYAAPANSPVYHPTPAPVTAPRFTPAIPAAAPAPAPVQAAPTSAPAYTIDQLTKAGADLAQAGKMPQLMGLLQQFGIQAITQLPPEQYGALATALRGLGAQL